MKPKVHLLTAAIFAFLFFVPVQGFGQQSTSTNRTNKPSQTSAKPAQADRKPPPAANPDNSAIEALEPFSRTVVERHSKFFVVSVDGTYWDRQIWLKRQELRDRMRKSVAAGRVPSDVERAHGASSTAPMDPDDESDGIVREKSTGAYRYKDDLINPPLWRAKDGRTAITAEEIWEARQSARAADDDKDAGKTSDKNKLSTNSRPRPYPVRDVSASELAWAIKEGRAELSRFSWRKRVLQTAFQPKQGDTNPPRAESAEFSWFREPVAVYWKSERVRPEGAGSAPEGDESKKSPALPNK